MTQILKENINLMKTINIKYLFKSLNTFCTLHPSGTWLKGLMRIQWSSSIAHWELCNLKGASEDDCQNYVRVFGRQGPDKFLACGTNAYKPQCKQFVLK
ncbi:hypothetical protein PV326_003231, partial [Microctonus aethiopoides]